MEILILGLIVWAIKNIMKSGQAQSGKKSSIPVKQWMSQLDNIEKMFQPSIAPVPVPAPVSVSQPIPVSTMGYDTYEGIDLCHDEGRFVPMEGIDPCHDGFYQPIRVYEEPENEHMEHTAEGFPVLTKDSLVQAVVMSEILNRPIKRAGRRIR